MPLGTWLAVQLRSIIALDVVVADSLKIKKNEKKENNSNV